MRNCLFLITLLVSAGLGNTVVANENKPVKEAIEIVVTGAKNDRIDFGVTRLTKALNAAGYTVSSGKLIKKGAGKRLIVGLLDEVDIQKNSCKTGR
ncbi:hypothetical protein LZG94_05220 [Dyadobacter sp. CY343]|nr:hypothetical protein [Dyadobacter sp. CY343]